MDNYRTFGRTGFHHDSHGASSAWILFDCCLESCGTRKDLDAFLGGIAFVFSSVEFGVLVGTALENGCNLTGGYWIAGTVKELDDNVLDDLCGTDSREGKKGEEEYDAFLHALCFLGGWCSVA